MPASLQHYARRATQAVQILGTIRLLKDFSRRFGRRPVLGIVGARDGAGGVHRVLAARGLIDILGFEPDKEECERLTQLQPYASFQPWALGDVTGPRSFHITAHPGCSSCLEPDMAVLERYPVKEWFRVARTVDVTVHRFDELYPGLVKTRPDFIQMDVQGFETRVLEGFGEHLDHVIGVQSEAHFRPLYKDQALLWELRDLLDSRGLMLRHVRPQGAFEGEVVEAEVWFSRLAKDLTDEQRALLEIWEGMSFLPAIDRFNGT